MVVSGSVLEAPAFVAGFDDLAVVGDPPTKLRFVVVHAALLAKYTWKTCAPIFCAACTLAMRPVVFNGNGPMDGSCREILRSSDVSLYGAGQVVWCRLGRPTQNVSHHLAIVVDIAETDMRLDLLHGGASGAPQS
jgi:hypothetical protein